MVSKTEYDKFIFSDSSFIEFSGVDLAELSRRRDELRFLKLQYDSEKSAEDLRYDCIEAELAEVERKIDVLGQTAKSPSDERRSNAEEDLLRQERIG